MKVQQFIREHGLEKLTERFGIKVREYPDRYVLNYCQIESSGQRFEQIVRECRALILTRDFQVLSRTFDRFFNLGEDPQSTRFSIAQSQVFEKLDGSLLSVYHDGREWCVQSRSMAHAEGETASGKTFREVFDLCLLNTPAETFQQFTSHLNENYTYIFEMVSPENRVVKSYGSSRSIYLLGIRDKSSGEFLSQDVCDLIAEWDLGVPRPRRYEFGTVQEVLDSMPGLPVLDEGYIAVIETPGQDPWYLKIKNPAYLAVANLRMNGAISGKRVITLVVGNDHEEYLGYFPEDREVFAPYIQAWADIRAQATATMEKFGAIQSQKEFALEVKDLPFANIVFQMRRGTSFDECVKRATSTSLERLFERIIQE